MQEFIHFWKKQWEPNLSDLAGLTAKYYFLFNLIAVWSCFYNLNNKCNSIIHQNYKVQDDQR